MVANHHNHSWRLAHCPRGYVATQKLGSKQQPIFPFFPVQSNKY
jgi:hypothetical protein